MYTPNKFSITDRNKISEFISDYNFGLLLSSSEFGIEDTHTPFFASDDLTYLYGHIARANIQWKGWSKESNVKVVFHGPHTYISPRYYESSFNVPTWNYTAVSVSGEVQVLVDIEEQKKVIWKLVERNESVFSDPWILDESDQGYMRLFDAIVCFRVRITGLEAKFKLNQNKSDSERDSVIKHLKKSGGFMDKEVAKFMENA